MAKKPSKRKRNTPMSNETPVVAASTPRSTSEKLASAEALVLKYRALLNSEQQINDVQVGDEVSFSFGRAAKVVTLTGVVTAVADTDTGRKVAIQTGSGLDVAIKKVRAADITENRSATARNAESAGDPVESSEAPEGDPLNAE